MAIKGSETERESSFKGLCEKLGEIKICYLSIFINQHFEGTAKHCDDHLFFYY